MNCDQCKEQVLELIEREAVDPEGVRELLARCPDCRAAFDEMKAVLAATALPFEEPPAAADAAILRAAAARRPKVVPLRRRWYQSPQWAVAAVAMLAVGVGVWTIPRELRLEADEAAIVESDAVEGNVPARIGQDELGVTASLAEMEGPRTVEAPPAEEAIALADEAESGDWRQVAAKLGRSKRAPAKRKSGMPRDEPAATLAPAPTQAPAAARAGQDMAAGAAAESIALEADRVEAEEPKKEQRELSPGCQKKLRQLERRKRDDQDAVDPEEALLIGRCYQDAGDSAQARAWLQRAAAHEETKERAQRALSELAAD